MVKNFQVGCGHCYECQMLRRTEWSFRMQYETLDHPNAYFLTLTYDDENNTLEDFDPDTQLFYSHFDHMQVFIRELRRKYSLRYFGVHEYGSTTYRRHYHLIVWLMDNDVKLELSDVQKLWHYGFVEKSNLNNSRIHYVTKYLNKPFRKYNTTREEILNSNMSNLEKYDELRNLLIRSNTFNFMSLKPAIGAGLLDNVELCNYIIESTFATGNYPKVFLNGKEFSIPRYYLRKLFVSEERLKIYYDNLNNSVDNDRLKSSKLGLDITDYYKHKRASDELKLDRVNKVSPYESI